MDIHKDSSLVQNTPWTSIRTVAFLSFASAVQFSLYFSSTWPYLQLLDDNVSESFYGIIISAFSFGQMIGSMLFGYWSNRAENVRTPCTICILISFIGNLIYIIAAVNPSESRYFILVARFVVGIGAGNAAILKSYAAMASSPEDRSQALAWITGGVSLGATLGPALAIFFTPIGHTGYQIFDRVYLNMYTAPAFFACFINIAGIVCLWYLFSEKYAGLVEKSEDGSSEKELPMYDIGAIIVCHITLFAQRFTFTNLETLGAPIGQSIFAWTKSEVVFYIGLAHALFSLVALLVNVVFVTFKMEKIINFRIHCIVSLIGLMLFHLLTFDWPFLPGQLKSYTQQEYEYATSFDKEIVGCNSNHFNWCDKIKPLNVWIYYAAYIILIGLFFPSINITLNTLFSKILGPRRMATQQALLQNTGSFARLLGPLLISKLYVEFGPRLAWILELAVLSVAVLFWLKFYNRMVPLNLEKNELKSRSSSEEPLMSEC